MPSNGYYYFAFTGHASEGYVCDWIGLGSDRYIPQVTILDGLLTLFNPIFPLEKVNEREEELHDILCPQISSQARQTLNANSAG